MKNVAILIVIVAIVVAATLNTSESEKTAAHSYKPKVLVVLQGDQAREKKGLMPAALDRID